MSRIQDGYYAFDNDLNSVLAAIEGTFVESGGAVAEHGTPQMKVVMAVVVYYINGVQVSKVETEVVITAADGSQPRKDIIVGDSAGNITAVAGTKDNAAPSASTGPQTYKPKPPDIPADKVLLAEVWVEAGETTILDADITDRRVIRSAADMSIYPQKAQDEIITGDWTYNGQLWTKSGIRNVKAHGAKGDGSTVDNVAVQAAAAALEDGETLYFPAGVYHGLTQEILKNNLAFGFAGDGPELTKLKFTDCHGLVADTNAVDKMIVVRDISFLTTSAGTYRALALENADVDSNTKQTVIVENVHCGPWDEGNDYWATGIRLSECWNAKLESIYVRGKFNNLSMTYGIELLGRSIDCHIDNLHAFFCATGVYAAAEIEGLRVSQICAVYVNVGVDLNTDGPGAAIIGGHISAFSNGVVARALSHEGRIIGILIYKNPGSTENFAGVQINSTAYEITVGLNTIKGAGAGGGENGVVVAGDRCVVSSNIICDQDGSAVWVQATADCTTVGLNTGTGNGGGVVDQGTNTQEGLNAF